MSLKVLYQEAVVSVTPYESFVQFKKKALENLECCPQVDDADFFAFYDTQVVSKCEKYLRYQFIYFDNTTAITTAVEKELKEAIQLRLFYGKRYMESHPVIRYSTKAGDMWQTLSRYCDDLIDNRCFSEVPELITFLGQFDLPKCFFNWDFLELKAKFLFESGQLQECLAVCESPEFFWSKERYKERIRERMDESEKEEGEPDLSENSESAPQSRMWLFRILQKWCSSIIILNILKLIQNDLYGESDEEGDEELETSSQIEVITEKDYFDCMPAPDKDSDNMIASWKWYSWGCVNESYDGRELEKMLMRRIKTEWAEKKYEEARVHAAEWFAFQSEGSGEQIRAQAILVSCYCAERNYTEASKRLKTMLDYYKKCGRFIKKAAKNDEEIPEWLGSAMDYGYDIPFWQQRVSELETLLPENHPLLSMERLILCHIYLYRAKSVKARDVFVKIVKGVIATPFHNWNFWWEPDT